MRVLIVEDEFLIASDVADTLKEAGCHSVAIAPSVEKALAILAKHEIDAAILDANLNGTSSEPVAVALHLKGIPFMVVSGYSNERRSGLLQQAPFLTKPCQATELVRLLSSLTARETTRINS